MHKKIELSTCFSLGIDDFFMRSYKFSKFRSHSSHKAEIKGLRLSRKFWIKKSLFRVVVVFNSSKTDCKYSRYTAQLIISFNWYWASGRIVFQMSSIKTCDSFGLHCKKILNLFHTIGSKVLALICCLWCYHQNKAWSLKKVVAKET